jgi:UDP-3-O-[3-hydroxymyristoyl] glucosamine N-acyltransferase
MAKFSHLFSTPRMLLKTISHTNPDGTTSTIHISPATHIEPDVYIGENTSIFANVSIYQGTKIGKNCILHSNCVIGSDGFGYEPDENGQWFKIAHLGAVVIHDNVEIGANSCIDRGTLGDTIIEENVKIDNLVHVAHNVHIGKNSQITAGTIISGSCVIGKDVWLAPGSVLKDGLKIGEKAFVGIGTVVAKDVEPETRVFGVPARKI